MLIDFPAAWPAGKTETGGDGVFADKRKTLAPCKMRGQDQ